MIASATPESVAPAGWRAPEKRAKRRAAALKAATIVTPYGSQELISR
jgi:hypothetical protein